MADKHWENMPLSARYKVYEAYRQTILEKEGWEISFDECNQGWTGCRWITIKYTFGVINN